MNSWIRSARGWQGFSLSFALIALVWGFFLIKWGYKGSFLKLNALYTPWLDEVMPHFTHLGDGLIITGIFLVFFGRKNLALVWAGLVSMVALPLLMTLLKGYIFRGWDRPPRVFGNEVAFRYLTVAGEQHMSFPSGHSAAAFTLLTLAAFQVKTMWQGALLAILAAAIAWSRLYIGVHFLGDILAGSALGYALATACALGVYGPVKHRYEQKGKVFGPKTEWIIAGLGVVLGLIQFVALFQKYYQP